MNVSGWGPPSAKAHSSSARYTHECVKESALQPGERERPDGRRGRAHIVSQRAIRGRASPASAGQSSMSAGHQA